jgi:hypothetical protein
VAVDPQHDVRVDLAEQHHAGNLHRLLVRDPQAFDEAHLHAELLHVRGDVRAAAVDDHRVQSHVLEQHHVGGEGFAELLLPHRGAAVLDDDGLAVELLDVGQRLQQRLDVPGLVSHLWAVSCELFMSCTPR